MSKFGFELMDERTFRIGGKKYDIPNAEIELSTIFKPEEQSYNQVFPQHDTEPLCAYKALDPYCLKLNWQLSKIKRIFTENADNLYKMQQDLQAPEAAKLLSKDVQEYCRLVAEARQMAADKNAFVDMVKYRATLLSEPSCKEEMMVRTIAQQTIRQELAARYKRLGQNDMERTSSALRSITKTGDLVQDLNLLEAVRKNTLFEPSEGIFKMAEKKLVEAYYPWISDLEEIAKVVEKWTANRMTFQAMPALKEALPFGLTPESIKEMTEPKSEPENLTEMMKKAA